MTESMINERIFDEWFLPLTIRRSPASSFRYALEMYLQAAHEPREIQVNKQLLSALEALRDNIGTASLSRNPVGRKLRADADLAILAAKLGFEEISAAQMDAEDSDPVDAAYAKGYADGYKPKATEQKRADEQ